MMKIRVIGDGTPTGTVIDNSETGEELPASAIRINLSPDGIVTATVELIIDELAIVGSGINGNIA